MVTDLGLKGNELIVYALINGFTQDGESIFYGSLTYIQEFTGLSRQGVINVLNSLETKNLIEKVTDKTTNGYRVVKKVDKVVKKVDIDNNNISSIKKEIYKERKEMELPYDSDAFKESWTRLITTPKWKKKTESQLEFTLNKLKRVSEMDAIVAMDEAFERNYTGVFPKNTTPIAKPTPISKKPKWEELGMTKQQYLSMFGK